MDRRSFFSVLAGAPLGVALPTKEKALPDPLDGIYKPIKWGQNSRFGDLQGFKHPIYVYSGTAEDKCACGCRMFTIATDEESNYIKVCAWCEVWRPA